MLWWGSLFTWKPSNLKFFHMLIRYIWNCTNNQGCKISIIFGKITKYGELCWTPGCTGGFYQLFSVHPSARPTVATFSQYWLVTFCWFCTKLGFDKHKSHDAHIFKKCLFCLKWNKWGILRPKINILELCSKSVL